jgi:hypothetical protein
MLGYFFMKDCGSRFIGRNQQFADFSGEPKHRHAIISPDDDGTLRK